MKSEEVLSRRMNVILAVCCSVMIALAWSLAALSSASERRQIEKTAVQNGEKLSKVMSESIERMIQSLERDFDRWELLFGRGPRPDSPRFSAQSFLDSAVVFTAWRRPDGTVFADPGAAQPWLKDLKWPGAPVLTMAAGPTLVQTSGDHRVLVPFFRSIRSRDGWWTAAAAVDFSWMESFFTGVGDWGMTSVSLFSEDGALLFRYPHPSLAMNVNFLGRLTIFEQVREKPAGWSVNVSQFDGKERLVVYRRLQNLPLILTVNHETKLLFSAWRQHSLYRGSLAFLGSFLILFFALLVLRFRHQLDVSRENRRLFEQSMRRHDKLEAVGRFSGALAHDFNNILTLIFGALDRLDSRARTAEAREVIDRLTLSTIKARDLVKQIRAFSRPAGTKPQAIDLREALERALDLLKLRDRVPIEIVPRSASPRVRMEPVLLEQILLETFAFSESKMAGWSLRLVVSEEAAAPVIRLGWHLQPPFPSSEGLSQSLREHLLLSSVRPLLESAGGWLEFQNTPEAPALSLLFPADLAVEDEDGRAKESWVLFVDSEEAVVELVRDFLTGHGMRVFATWDVAAALEEFRSRPADFCLAVTEFRRQPLEISRELRRIRPEIPLVLLQNGGPEAFEEPVFPDENIMVLGKPYRFQDLLAAILRLKGRVERGLTLKPLPERSSGESPR